jgi:hypothetical protein
MLAKSENAVESGRATWMCFGHESARLVRRNKDEKIECDEKRGDCGDLWAGPRSLFVRQCRALTRTGANSIGPIDFNLLRRTLGYPEIHDIESISDMISV